MPVDVHATSTPGAAPVAFRINGKPSPKAEQLWAAMRILRQFNVGQLRTTVAGDGVSKGWATHYVTRLIKCGYIRRLRQRRLGVPGDADDLLLVRNTGPMPPLLRHGVTAIFDPNLGHDVGQDGVRLDPAPPKPPRRRPVGPMLALAVTMLAEGRTMAEVMARMGSLGPATQVRNGLHRRGWVDAQGVITAAGRRQADAQARGEGALA